MILRDYNGRELDYSVRLPLVRVLATDPGDTTGWAAIRDGELLGGQIGPEEHHLEYWELLHEGWDWIVCESFEFRQQDKTGLSLMSKEYIGLNKLYRRLASPMVKFHFQNASVGKGFIKDDKLKRMGLYQQTKGQVHERDALRHLFHFVVTTMGGQLGREVVQQWLQNTQSGVGPANPKVG